MNKPSPPPMQSHERGGWGFGQQRVAIEDDRNGGDAIQVERMARAIARQHFLRKQHYGVCTQEECVAYLVERHWRNSIPEAEAAIAAALKP